MDELTEQQAGILGSATGLQTIHANLGSHKVSSGSKSGRTRYRHAVVSVVSSHARVCDPALAIAMMAQANSIPDADRLTAMKPIVTAAMDNFSDWCLRVQPDLRQPTLESLFHSFVSSARSLKENESGNFELYKRALQSPAGAYYSTSQ